MWLKKVQMILGKVIGNVVSVIKDKSYMVFKLMVVQEKILMEVMIKIFLPIILWPT